MKLREMIWRYSNLKKLFINGVEFSRLTHNQLNTEVSSNECTYNPRASILYVSIPQNVFEEKFPLLHSISDFTVRGDKYKQIYRKFNEIKALCFPDDELQILIDGIRDGFLSRFMGGYDEKR